VCVCARENQRTIDRDMIKSLSFELFVFSRILLPRYVCTVCMYECTNVALLGTTGRSRSRANLLHYQLR
jgi:hypothetical protein